VQKFSAYNFLGELFCYDFNIFDLMPMFFLSKKCVFSYWHFLTILSQTRTKRLKKRETSCMNVSSLGIYFSSRRLSFAKKGQNRCTLMQSSGSHPLVAQLLRLQNVLTVGKIFISMRLMFNKIISVGRVQDVCARFVHFINIALEIK
jgi:hypothetical protein